MSNTEPKYTKPAWAPECPYLEGMTRQGWLAAEAAIYAAMERNGTAGREEPRTRSARVVTSYTESAEEEMLSKCIQIIWNEKKCSSSLFQRRLAMPYLQAIRMLNLLEARGFIGAGKPGQPREILRQPTHD